MTEQPIQDFATSLEAMTDDELFMAMAGLEKKSEQADGDARDEVLARIALVEGVITERYPGQALTPYRSWKERELLL